MKKPIALPAFPVHVTTLPSRGMEIVLQAQEGELAAIAAHTGISELISFRATLQFRRWRKDGVAITGEIAAELEQLSVISLEPVHQKLRETFEATFLPEGSRLAKPKFSEEGEMLLDPEGPDAPDMFAGDTIDAWPVVLEHFQLALDPFPRLEGEELQVRETADMPGEGPGVAPDEGKDRENSPFAVLRQLKQRNSD